MGNCCSSDSAVAPEPAPKLIKAVTLSREQAKAQEAANDVAKAQPKGEKAAEEPVTTKIAVIYYSTYGHIAKLAKQVVDGVNSVPGVQGDLFQVEETLPADVLEAMHAPAKDADVPIFKAEQLADYDGFLFGFPTRFGTIPAQFKALLDSTGALWMNGALVGKGMAIFTGSGTQGGGLESTVLFSLPVFTHHGMVFIPTGYSFGERLFGVETPRAGTAYGASTFAGPDGSRQPIELELDYAKYQGTYVAGVVKKLAAK